MKYREPERAQGVTWGGKGWARFKELHSIQFVSSVCTISTLKSVNVYFSMYTVYLMNTCT